MFQSSSEPDESSPQPPKTIFKDVFYYYPPSVLRSSEWSHLHIYWTEGLLQYKITQNNTSQNWTATAQGM